VIELYERNKPMAEMFTISLSEETVRRAQEEAARTARPIEAVLEEWIERSAHDDACDSFVPGVEYPIYTPVDSDAAAEVLMRLLKKTEEDERKLKKE
jgi:hypothetical protein